MKRLADRRRMFLPVVRTANVFKPPIDADVDVPKGLVRDWGERRLILLSWFHYSIERAVCV